MNIEKWFPFSGWIKKYSREDFKSDLPAGLTVGVMLIPQGMAYSMLAGLPPIYGLYASTIPLILYALFGTSRQLAVGPVAMISLFIATGVGSLAPVGSPEYIGLAILLALMVGIIQFSLGLFRLGFLVNFLSRPVISGFTSAAALIIGLSQLKYLLGINISRTNFIHEVLYQAFLNAENIHVLTVILGGAGILVVLIVQKWRKAIPGPLIAVALSIVSVYAFGLYDKGVTIVGEIPGGLPSFFIPPFSWDGLNELLPMAITISLVGFMQSIAAAKAMQARHKNYQIDSNQELIGLGIANIGGSFFQSFPITGGFSRTAVNDQVGGKTAMSSIVSAALIIFTLLFLTPLFYYLPNAILASVIMVAVFGLIDYKEALHLWKVDKRDFLMLLTTFIATLFMGIEEGILLGVMLSLAMVVYRSTYPHMALLGKVPGTAQYRNIKRFPLARQFDHILIVRFDAPLFFANISYLKDKIAEMESGREEDIRLIILSAEAINGMDSSAVYGLLELIEEYRKRGIVFYLSGVTGPIRDIMHRGGLIQYLGEENFFMYVDEAVSHFTGKQEGKEMEKGNTFAIQANIG